MTSIHTAESQRGVLGWYWHEVEMNLYHTCAIRVAHVVAPLRIIAVRIRSVASTMLQWHRMSRRK